MTAMLASGENSLDKLLQKATNPSGIGTDWTAIDAFAKKVNEAPETIPSALRLLIHRIQSFEENEAINGLLTLEVCAEKCGVSFHDEIGKFRFLNELIKLISPKYLGNRTAPVVKQKAIGVLYKWTKTIKDQPKIQDAYEMLKKQNVVKDDPVYETPPPPQPSGKSKSSVFEDEEKAKLLQKLLHSGNRDDVQAANRLIKSMVKEDERKMERLSRKLSELETVGNNVKVLSDMLTNYEKGNTSVDDVELIKELYLACDKLRPNLFRMASDTDDSDENLGNILRANDELVRVIEQYKRIFGPDEPVPASATAAAAAAAAAAKLPPPSTEQASSLSLLDLGSPLAATPSVPSLANITDDQLLTLDDVLGHSTAAATTSSSDESKSDMEQLGDIFSSVPAANAFGIGNLSLLTPTKSGMSNRSLESVSMSTVFDTPSNIVEERKVNKGLEELDALGVSLLKQALPLNMPIGTEFPKVAERVPMNQMKKQAINLGSQEKADVFTESAESSPAHEINVLADLHVSLETIKTGAVPPLTLYNKNGLNVVIHFGNDRPKPNVSVMVVTTINQNPDPVTCFFFQAAVPKSMKLKLQPPSSNRMPAFNPIIPPSAITQVMLLANSTREKVKLKYKITYVLRDQNHVDIDEIEHLSLT